MIGLLALVVALHCGAPVFGGGVLFVDGDAAPAGDGMKWDTAYRFLQDALAFAGDADNGVAEIHLAQGSYRPDHDEAHPNGTGDREATFRLVDSVALLGGFAGAGADDPDARDVDAFETILSGDIGTPGKREDNSYNVLQAVGVQLIAVIDGLTITQGHADGPIGNPPFVFDRGAGIHITGTDSTITRCRFVDNQATCVGGAVWVAEGAATFSGCRFAENMASPGEAAGAIHAVFGSTLTITECSFEHNSAGPGATGGGAIFIGGDVGESDPSVLRAVNCEFIGNEAPAGGAIMNNGIASLTNCLFGGNTAFGKGSKGYTGRGGALANFGECAVINCTVYANTSVSPPGGVYTARGTANTRLESQMSMANAILWGNLGGAPTEEENQIIGADSLLEVNYSCIKALTGNLGGVGNISDHPKFINELGIDGIAGTADDVLHLLLHSPCIDAGDSMAIDKTVIHDLAGQARIVDTPCTEDTGNMGGREAVVDMGVFEFQGTPHPLGDLSGDGVVGTTDLLLLLSNWGPCDGCCLGDLNLDGAVGTIDLLTLLGHWG